VTDQGDEQPEPDLRSRPCSDQRDEQHDLERSVRWYPEPFSRNPSALRLDEIWPLRPEGVDDGELVERTADPNERQPTLYPGQKYMVVHPRPSLMKYRPPFSLRL